MRSTINTNDQLIKEAEAIYKGSFVTKHAAQAILLLTLLAIFFRGVRRQAGAVTGTRR